MGEQQSRALGAVCRSPLALLAPWGPWKILKALVVKEMLVGAVGIEPTTLNFKALPLEGLGLYHPPEVPIQVPQTVLVLVGRRSLRNYSFFRIDIEASRVPRWVTSHSR